jgi:hypothetical protein
MKRITTVTSDGKAKAKGSHNNGVCPDLLKLSPRQLKYY